MTDATNKFSEIYNFEQMTDWLGTSGQPEREQFEAIAEAGYRAVINLALPTSDNAIADEASIVTGLGMGYHHIPVKFEEPTVDDLRTFLGVMRALDGKKIWVHCVVNARVSAFVFQYLRYEKGVDDDNARSKLLTQWEPQMDDTWRDFLRIPKEAVQ
jgi:protein tyrosine phosphatase (PTP) superfamily phosphohydrolase (DUF442 family)